MKGAELQAVVDEVEPHVVFLTETKLLKDMVISQYLDCTNFSVFRRDRGQGRGGGVMILVRKGLWVSEVSEQVWGDIEAVICQVIIGQKSILLACIYRPPTAAEETNEQLLQAVQRICDLPFNQVLICGDFNFRDID